MTGLIFVRGGAKKIKVHLDLIEGRLSLKKRRHDQKTPPRSKVKKATPQKYKIGASEIKKRALSSKRSAIIKICTQKLHINQSTKISLFRHRTPQNMPNIRILASTYTFQQTP